MDDSWSLIDFLVSADIGELVSDTLWSMGVVAIEEIEGPNRTLVLRTSMGSDPSPQIAAVRERHPELLAEMRSIPRSTADTWRAFAVPTFVDSRVALVPAWVPAPDGCVPIFIEPRDTFGLGNHPTTILTLRLALRLAKPADAVFDFGCGSGVLAVALAKLSDAVCDVFDIADSSKKAVAENCRLNEVSTVHWQENFATRTYDLVLANILAPILRSESSVIAGMTREEGCVVMSGMREEQVATVLRAYPEWEVFDHETLEGWAAISIRRS